MLRAWLQGYDGVLQAMQELDRRHGRLDILVNNVGIRDRRGIFEFDLDDP